MSGRRENRYPSDPSGEERQCPRVERRPSVQDLDGLRQAWQAGIDSGGYKPAGEVFDRLIARYARKAKSENL